MPSTVNMVSHVTAETFKRLNFNAGVALHDIDLSKASDAASLAELITSNDAQAKWFGATKGNPRINENKSYWEPGMNGKRMPFKNEAHFDTARPSLSITLVEFTPENLKAASGAAVIDRETGGNVTTVQPLADVAEDSYFSNVIVVLNNGANGLYVAELKNALCVSGANSSFADKDIGSIDMEFVAHSDSPVFTNELPIKYYFFASATD